jgi:hypothetical protein
MGGMVRNLVAVILITIALGSLAYYIAIEATYDRAGWRTGEEDGFWISHGSNIAAQAREHLYRRMQAHERRVMWSLSVSVMSWAALIGLLYENRPYAKPLTIRFTLRTLLVATTVVAAALGFAVYAATK